MSKQLLQKQTNAKTLITKKLKNKQIRLKNQNKKITPKQTNQY